MDLRLVFSMAHWVVAIAVGIACVRFWVRTRFWLPRYVHCLAGVALVPGVFIVSIAVSDPAGRAGLPLAVLIALIFPAFVYAVFVFLGGQKAAHNARFGRRTMRCPGCGAIGRTRYGSMNPMDRRCTGCGAYLD